MSELSFLLLQIRDADDPILEQEVGCFARALGCDEAAIKPFDLLAGTPSDAQLQAAGGVLIGGSGDYSAAGEGEWLEQTLEGLRRLVASGAPTFASCWGFQAIARACGGRCIHDPPNAELGSIKLRLTDLGSSDPLFGGLPTEFFGQAGHEDHVVELPEDAVLLASSERVRHQAFRLAGKPVYCTQFHPELDLHTLVERLRRYPGYVQRIAGLDVETFAHQCRETPEANGLLRRFKKLVQQHA
ncbi:MAG: type 1 glutamine amidotransferase [Planctomycetota bacterium]